MWHNKMAANNRGFFAIAAPVFSSTVHPRPKCSVLLEGDNNSFFGSVIFPGMYPLRGKDLWHCEVSGVRT